MIFVSQSKWQGDTSKYIAAIKEVPKKHCKILWSFQNACLQVALKFAPSIVFLDEMEQYVPCATGANADSQELANPWKLAIEGWDENERDTGNGNTGKSITWVGCTNNLDSIDSAIKSRLKIQLFVPLPCTQMLQQAFQKKLQKLESEHGARINIGLELQTRVMTKMQHLQLSFRDLDGVFTDMCNNEAGERDEECKCSDLQIHNAQCTHRVANLTDAHLESAWSKRRDQAQAAQAGAAGAAEATNQEEQLLGLLMQCRVPAAMAQECKDMLERDFAGNLNTVEDGDLEGVGLNKGQRRAVLRRLQELENH